MVKVWMFVDTANTDAFWLLLLLPPTSTEEQQHHERTNHCSTFNLFLDSAKIKLYVNYNLKSVCVCVCVSPAAGPPAG